MKFQRPFTYYIHATTTTLQMVAASEAHRNRCTTNSITLCPADVPIYSQQVETCESSLYYQISTSNKLCRANLLFNYRIPTLQRHGTLWLYHLPQPRQITSRCPITNGWTTYTETLPDTGVIRNASKCSITTNELQTLPELHGEIQSAIVTTLLRT